MKILLIITGSIAAVKVPELIRKGKEQGHEFTCLLTQAAKKFITSESLSYLTANQVYDDLFEGSQGNMHHISLSRDNDIILVAPASANFIAKMANGICDDLATTLYLASDKPVIIAPAMNVKMYEHPAFKRNLDQLKNDGVKIIDAVAGKLACGEEGLGRLAEPDEIIKFLSSFNRQKKKNLQGLKCLVTSGPTRENIDPVRYISNYSSGKQGYAIAEALASEGADVTLVSGPTTIPYPKGVKIIHAESAQEMYNSCIKLLPVDIAICAAAVADWKAEKISDKKIKKINDSQIQILSLIENPDILFELSKPGKNRPKLVIGFAAETEHPVENALVKLERKGCDWIIANNVLKDKVFGSDKNTVCIISEEMTECIDDKPKEFIAQRITELVTKHFSKQKKS